MYSDIPLWMAFAFVAAGLWLLERSSDAFAGASAALSRRLGVSPFVIGVVIVGFGTSAPELCVSALSSAAGYSGLSFGNASGSCIFNIALILGVTVLFQRRIDPRAVFALTPPLARNIRRLLLVSVLAVPVLCSTAFLHGVFTARVPGMVLLAMFALSMFDMVRRGGATAAEAPPASPADAAPAWRLATVVVLSLALLLGSSHILVWGAVDLARQFHVSERLIGLTIVAIGTSLPELASSIAVVRRGEDTAIALGNIVGSNLFNILAVVGLAGAISPFRMDFGAGVIRDLVVLLLLTVSLLVPVMRRRATPAHYSLRLARVWVAVYLVYLAITIWSEVG